MPKNIELKARITNWDAACRVARSLATADLGELHQVDAYFRVPNGRLKLRQFSTPPAELIAYSRLDQPDAKASDYRIVKIADAEGILAMLSTALGVWARVEKRRRVYLHDNVRIHLDDVVGLGRFLEFEAVIDATHDEARCRETLVRLQRAFALGASDLLIGSYSDMIVKASGAICDLQFPREPGTGEYDRNGQDHPRGKGVRAARDDGERG
jgi:predicted adenylyl cyclase CyaB